MVPDIVQSKVKNMGIKVKLGAGGVYTACISGDEKRVSQELLFVEKKLKYT